MNRMEGRKGSVVETYSTDARGESMASNSRKKQVTYHLDESNRPCYLNLMVYRILNPSRVWHCDSDYRYSG